MLFYYVTGYGSDTNEVTAEVSLIRALIASGDLELVNSMGNANRRVYTLSVDDKSSALLYVTMLMKKFKHFTMSVPKAEIAYFKEQAKSETMEEGVAWIHINGDIKVQHGIWEHADLYTWVRVHHMLTFDEYIASTCGRIYEELITLHVNDDTTFTKETICRNKLLNELMVVHSNLYSAEDVEIQIGHTLNGVAKLTSFGKYRIEDGGIVHVE